MPRLREVLHQGVESLKTAQKESPVLDARLLLAKVLGCPIPELISRDDRELSFEHCERFMELLSRRLKHEPVAYILGFKEFYGREFCVNPSVLIPRPETELLVELGLKAAEFFKQPRICDLGTGSGAILISLACELREKASYIGVDISSPALELARQNAERLRAPKIEWCRQDMREPPALSVDLLLSNPPYLPRSLKPQLSEEIQDFEPAPALFAGDQGLEFYKAIFANWLPRLSTDGLALLETHDARQRALLINSLPREYQAEEDSHCLKIRRKKPEKALF